MQVPMTVACTGIAESANFETDFGGIVGIFMGPKQSVTVYGYGLFSGDQKSLKFGSGNLLNR